MPLLTAYLVIRTPRGNERRVSAFITELYHNRTNRSLFTRKSEEPDFGEYHITGPAHNLAQQHNIRTIDGDQLVTLVQQ